ATDELVAEGLELPTLAPGTIEAIEALLPDWQSAGNPSDLWSAAEVAPERALRDSFAAMLADADVDQVLGVLLAVPNIDFDGIGDVFAELRREHPDTPIHLVLHGSVADAWKRAIDGLGIPVYPTTREAVRVMGATARHAATR